MPDTPEATDEGRYDPSRAEANRQRMQGGAMGARDLDRQQDPTGSGAGTPDGEGGADGVERLDEDET